MRYRPQVPIGLPHRCMEGDVYRGWRIPKGSVALTKRLDYAARRETVREPLDLPS